MRLDGRARRLSDSDGKLMNSWARLMRILGQEGSNLNVYGIFLKAVVQVVLIFGFKT